MQGETTVRGLRSEVRAHPCLDTLLPLRLRADPLVSRSLPLPLTRSSAPVRCQLPAARCRLSFRPALGARHYAPFPLRPMAARPYRPQSRLDIGQEIALVCLRFRLISHQQKGAETMANEENEKKGFFGGVKAKFKDYVYGMAAHEMTRQALKTRGSMEHLFILITMGDLLGVPILPPYYSLRLLPYVVPQISTWKRRMLREKDLTDALA